MCIRDRSGDARDGNPIQLAGDKSAAQQVLVAADHHALRLRIGGNHVERLFGRDSQALPLADGEMMNALMLAEGAAVGGDDLSLIHI